MGQENNQSSNAFSGVNIEALEKGLGMIMPGGSGEPQGGKEPDEGNKETKKGIYMDVSYLQVNRLYYLYYKWYLHMVV